MRRIPRPVAWVVRVVVAGTLIAGAVIAWQRLRTTDEQDELTRYVEHQVPALLEREREVYARLDRLENQPGPTPAQARALFVDDVIPKLIALKARAQAVVARSPSLKAVNDEYVAYVDRLIDACRVSVRAIDDPGADPAAGNKLVRQRFFEAGQASKAWSAHLRDACVKARLAPPPSI